MLYTFNMISAKEARHLSMTEQERSTFYSISEQIETAISKGKSSIVVKSLPSYMLKSIIENDYGYTIRITGADAFGNQVEISW